MEKLDPQSLKILLPKCKDSNIKKYLEPLNMCIEKYNLSTPQRLGMFLAQTAHESASYNVVIENLNYKADQLLAVFGKYFDEESAKEYARHPERIANRVYANRMGNGPEESGDGWKYRGRGIIQITGKDMYAYLSKKMAYDFVNEPDALTRPFAAVLSAGEFWISRNLNTFADKGDFIGITKRINGGLNGYAERLAHWKHIRLVLKIPYLPESD
jgi:putative chitinase